MVDYRRSRHRSNILLWLSIVTQRLTCGRVCLPYIHEQGSSKCILFPSPSECCPRQIPSTVAILTSCFNVGRALGGECGHRQSLNMHGVEGHDTDVCLGASLFGILDVRKMIPEAPHQSCSSACEYSVWTECWHLRKHAYNLNYHLLLRSCESTFRMWWLPLEDRESQPLETASPGAHTRRPGGLPHMGKWGGFPCEKGGHKTGALAHSSGHSIHA